MSSYSAQVWPENGHGFCEGESYHGEVGRSVGRPFHHPHDPRRLHVVDGTAHANFISRDGSSGTWRSYANSYENGYQELPRGGPHSKLYTDRDSPRQCHRENVANEWRLYGPEPKQGSPRSLRSSHRHPSSYSPHLLSGTERRPSEDYDCHPKEGGLSASQGHFSRRYGSPGGEGRYSSPTNAVTRSPNDERWPFSYQRSGPRRGGGSGERSVYEHYTPSPSSSWSPSDTSSPRYHPPARGSDTEESFVGAGGARNGPPTPTENSRPPYECDQLWIAGKAGTPHSRLDGSHAFSQGRLESGNPKFPPPSRHLDGARGPVSLTSQHTAGANKPTAGPYVRRDDASHGTAIQRDPRLQKAVVSSPSCSHHHNSPTHSSSSSSSTSSASSSSCPPPKPMQILSEHSYFKHWTGKDEPPEKYQQQQGQLSQQRVKPPGGCFLTPAPQRPPLVNSILHQGSFTKSAAAAVPTPAMKSPSPVTRASSSPVSGDVSGLNSSVRGRQAKAPGFAGVCDVAADGLDAQVKEKDGAARSKGVAKVEEGDCGPPSPLHVSLNGFSLDLDSEPESSEAADEDEEEEEKEVDIEVEETSLIVSLPRAGRTNPEAGQSSTDNVKDRKTDCLSEKLVEKASAQQPLISAKPAPGNQIHVQQLNGPKINGFIPGEVRSLAQYASHKGSPSSAVPDSSARTRSKTALLSTARQHRAVESHKELGGEAEELEVLGREDTEVGEVVTTRRSARLQQKQVTHREEGMDEPSVGGELSGPSPLSPGAAQESSDVRGDSGMMEEEDVDMCRSGFRGRRKRGRSRRFFQYKKRQKKSFQPTAEEDGPAMSLRSRDKQGHMFQDFVPVVLPTRSRTETSTLIRRREMVRQIERNELERRLTARPGELADTEEQDQAVQDDASSVCSMATSSTSSRDIDSISTSSKSTLPLEFSPELIARCKKITTAKSSGDTPLHKICRTGRYDMARYLVLVENVPINAQDNAGWSPLHEACSAGKPRIAKLLLENGADVNISSTDGTRPIHDAVESGSLEVVQLLLRFGADPLAELGESTPAEYAADVGQPHLAQYLQGVVRERQQRLLKSRDTPVASSSTSDPPASQKLRRDKPRKAEDELYPQIPVDGYSDSDPKLTPELDYPLFYVSPIIELSQALLLPTYNFQVTSGPNPRRHNFYLLCDVLNRLCTGEQAFHRDFPDTVHITMTVAEFLKCMRRPHYNQQVSIPPDIKSLPRDNKLVFIPVCSQLQERLDIVAENMDD